MKMPSRNRGYSKFTGRVTLLCLRYFIQLFIISKALNTWIESVELGQV